MVGGAWLPGLAKWDGSNWSSVGGGLVPPAYPVLTGTALAAFDAGTGPELYVSGNFIRAGSVDVQGFAKWNGQQWSAVAIPIVDPRPYGPWRMHVAQTSHGPRLYDAGTFVLAGTEVFVSRFARI